MNSKEKQYDVIIVGGGPSGIAAAYGAAKTGAKTLVIEKAPFLGGNLTMQLPILVFHNQRGVQILAGAAQELVDRAISAGGCTGHIDNSLYSSMRTFTYIDVETMKLCADAMVIDAGADILFHSFVSGVVKEDKKVTGIIASGKGGEEKINSKVVVDCSADADIAYYAGAPTIEGDENGNIMAVTMSFRMVNIDHKVLKDTFPDWLTMGKRPGENEKVFLHGKTRFSRWGDAVVKENLFEDMDAANHSIFVVSMWDGEMTVNTSRMIGINPANKWDLSRGEIEGRKQVHKIFRFLKKHVKGFEKAVLIATGPFLGTRESRRIVGEYTMTANDCLNGKNFKDQIGRGAFPLDIHHHDGSGVQQTFIKEGGSYGIPYRILIPKEIDQVIVAGRSVSCDRSALGTLRQMGCCLATGHAAGIAAAQSCKGKTLVRDINIDSLQKTLHEQGAVLSEDDSPECIPTPKDYKGPEGVLNI